jgi:hypothetical protein
MLSLLKSLSSSKAKPTCVHTGFAFNKTQHTTLPRLIGGESPRCFSAVVIDFSPQDCYAIWLDPKYRKNQGCTGSPKNPNVALNKKNSLRSNSFLFLTLHLLHFLNVAPLRPYDVLSNGSSKEKPILPILAKD